MIEHKVATLASGPLHYVESRGLGPVLVLIHGLTESWASFEPILPALATTNHVYAYDLRGHGDSARTPGAYTFLNHARDAHAFLEQVVRRPAILLGHSLGGMVASYVAAHHPDHITGLILEDTSFFTEGEGFTDMIPWREGFLQLQEQPLEVWEQQVAQWMYDDTQTRQEVFGQAGVRRQVQQWIKMDPEHFDSVIDGSHWAGLNKDVILPAIRCPVLLIYCPSNEADARDHAQNLAQSAVLISDVNNHRIHELDPEAYTQYVQQFITMV